MADGLLAPEVEAWLRAGADGRWACDRVEETSISWLYFYPGRVLKLKKPLDLGFVDFTTPDRRRWAAQREVAFNRRTAPDVYRRVITISRGAEGRVGGAGVGEPLDYAVEMRRFDEAAILANRPPPDGDFAEDLGRRIARFHLTADRGTSGCGAGGMDYVIRSNADQLAGCNGGLDRAAVEGLGAATTAAFERLRSLLDERMAEGFCRACHGDLHLSNILVERGEPVLFDCIEFSDRLREIDVGYDVAFLLMDLVHRGAAVAANRALNGWLDEAARGMPASLWRGLATLPLFQSVRACVRAHVNAREGKAEAARKYLSAARRYLEAPAPQLIAVGGLSGSGKSTHARRLAPDLGGAPGAVVLRSDELRKRLWGVAPTKKLGPEAYEPEATAKVYEALFSTAREVLQAGRCVIADAAFLEPPHRVRIEAIAREAGAPFEGIWMEAPEVVLRGRLASRVADASDADAQVLSTQLARDVGAIEWRRMSV
ncbi:MAG: AAA family ATPase [Caulobacteraceae bacterium]|nr:AAA family ATPase [Caulobacteraceae bacterium]